MRRKLRWTGVLQRANLDQGRVKRNGRNRLVHDKTSMPMRSLVSFLYKRVHGSNVTRICSVICCGGY
jgi:hypothetical protein